jgi:hypothetical protein
MTATAFGKRTTRRTPFMLAIAPVDRLRRAAEDRTVGDRRIEHARQPHVDRVNRLGGDLSGHIKAPAGLAGELPVARILELHIGGRWHFRRRLGNGAEREFAPARLVRDHAHGGDAFKRRHVPARGRRRNQHFPRGSARLPQIKLRACDRAAGAGRHVAPDAVAAHIFLRRDELG